jgi:CheY-like chemotaxis protein
VRLPLSPENETPLPLAPASAARMPAGPRPLAQRSVLVVDDNQDAAESLAELLRVEGADVVTAHSGPEALRIAAERPLDVAVLDIGMPGMDGCELARRLRAGPQAAQPPLLLIALTGWGQQADQRRIAQAGFDHHLLKPVGTDRLIALIAAARPAPA